MTGREDGEENTRKWGGKKGRVRERGKKVIAKADMFSETFSRKEKAVQYDTSEGMNQEQNRGMR